MTSAARPFEAVPRGVRLDVNGRQLGLTLLLLVVSAAAATAASIQYGEVAAALVFVLGITVAGALGGLAASLVAAILAFLIYNFYLTEPALSFRVATGRDIAPLIIFNLCALVSGILAGRLRDAVEAARLSNLQLNSLLELSQQLQSAIRLADVVATVSSAAHRITGARLALFRKQDELTAPLADDHVEAEWQAFADAMLAGSARSGESGSLMGRRVEAHETPPTVMIVESLRPRGVARAFVDALGNIVSLAMERAALSEQMTERRAAARAEELKTALLASVSHDFRTPLTAIAASASSLIDYREKLDAPTSARLLRGIVEECERLNRYTANLLEMSRLASGGEPGGMQILGVGEMLAAAVQRVRGRAGHRTIMLREPGPEQLIAANPGLFELVLVNLLDNAILYSDDGTRIEVDVDSAEGMCRIAVVDEGHGIPEDELERVFDRFYRVKRCEAPRGSGLGLAIARAFVEAQGGTIGACVPGIGTRGTRMTVRLPLIEQPAR